MKLRKVIIEIGKKAKIASYQLSIIKPQIKINALKNGAKEIKKNSKKIILANKIDIKNAIKNNLSNALINRLELNEKKINDISKSLIDIAKLPEPIVKTLSQWKRPNGLNIQKVTVPIGVIGIIYESRPNVTADASALGIKSSNAIILRGGKDSFNTSKKFLKS